MVGLQGLGEFAHRRWWHGGLMLVAGWALLAASAWMLLGAAVGAMESSHTGDTIPMWRVLVVPAPAALLYVALWAHGALRARSPPARE